MKDFIKTLLREELNNKQIIRLYHRVGNKKGMDVESLIKNVMTNGLIPSNNGEVGSVIWFSTNYNDYGENGDFVLAYDYDTSKGYVGNNGITYSSWSAPFGHEPIPFDKLIVIKIPIIRFMRNNDLMSDEEVMDYINKRNWTPDNFNSINRDDMVMYGDLFNKYVQPYINYPNFLDEIDKNKFKLINIL